jgi:nitrite reductase (NADH) small subunit
MAFVKIISQSHLPPTNEAADFPCDGRPICIANIWGKFSAMDNVCLHQGGSLGQGTIDNGKVVCPWHGWRWDPKTGEAEEHPGQKLKTYALKVENGDVFIDI